MKFQLKQGFIVQKNGNKISIFDPEKSILHSFNETGSYIFEQVKKGLEEEKIVKNIVKKFKISETEAKNDFEEFIKDLKRKKIIS